MCEIMGRGRRLCVLEGGAGKEGAGGRGRAVAPTCR